MRVTAPVTTSGTSASLMVALSTIRQVEVSLDAARRAGVVSAKRVLDSTPLYDAVATQGHGDVAYRTRPRSTRKECTVVYATVDSR